MLIWWPSKRSHNTVQATTKCMHSHRALSVYISVLFIVKFRPDLIDMELVVCQSNRENLEQAFEIAESLGVTRLLDAEGSIQFVSSDFTSFGFGFIYSNTFYCWLANFHRSDILKEELYDFNKFCLFVWKSCRSKILECP